MTRKRPPWADAPVGEWQVLNGHEGLVSSVRFSPDGRTAASASWDGTVRLWDVAGGRPLWAFNTRGDKRERIGQVYAMVFSPDGREVIASGQGQVWVLDAKTGREIRRFNVNLGFIRGLAVLPDGERLLVGGTSVWLVDLATGRKLRSFEEPTDLISSLQVSPDGRLAMWSGAYYTNSDTETDALVKVWELETGKPVFEYAPDVRTGIHQAIFSPDGTRLLAPAVHQQEQLVLWDIATDKRLREFPQYDNVYGLAFSPDGRRVVCGDIHGLVRVFSVNSGELIHSFKSNGKSSRIESVDVSPDGRLVISGSASGAMRLWRLPALATQSSSWSAELRHMLSARRGREAVLAVAISPNGDQALSAHRDLTLRLWDLSTGRELKKFQGDRAWHLINDIAWSPDGQYALLGGGQYIGSQRLTLWDVKEWQEMRRFEGHENPIACVAFSPNGRTALSGTGEGDVFAWDVQTGERISHYDAPVRKTLDLAFSPDGRYGLFAGGYRDHRLRLFDIRTGRERHVFEQPDSAVVAAVFGDGGQQVLSASEDGLIRVWNAHRGTSLREFNVSGEIHSAAFSDDGRLVLVGGSDGTLRLWNVEAEEPVLWLVDHRQFGRHGGDRPPIAELDLSSDMQHAVSSIPTDPIFVWELHKDELIDGLQQ